MKFIHLFLTLGWLLWSVIPIKAQVPKLVCDGISIVINTDPASSFPSPTSVAAEEELIIQQTSFNGLFPYTLTAGKEIRFEGEFETQSPLTAFLQTCNIPWVIHYDSLQIIEKEDNDFIFDNNDDPYLLTIGFSIPLGSNCPSFVLADSPCSSTPNHIGPLAELQPPTPIPGEMGAISFQNIPIIETANIDDLLTEITTEVASLGSTLNEITIRQLLEGVEIPALQNLDLLLNEIIIFGTITIAVEKDQGQDFFCNILASVENVFTDIFTLKTGLITTLTGTISPDILGTLGGLGLDVGTSIMAEIGSLIPRLIGAIPIALINQDDDIIGIHLFAFLNLEEDYHNLINIEFEDVLENGIPTQRRMTLSGDIFGGIKERDFAFYNNQFHRLRRLKNNDDLDAEYHLGATIKKGYEGTSYGFNFVSVVPCEVESLVQKPGYQEQKSTQEERTILSSTIESEADLSFKIAPNPVSDRLSLFVDLVHPDNVQIELFDMYGRSQLARLEHMLDVGPHRLEIDASGLPNGTYLLRLTTAEGITAQEKFIKTAQSY